MKTNALKKFTILPANLVAVAFCLLPLLAAQAGDGIVGSPTWFRDTENIAIDQANQWAFASAHGTNSTRPLPADYVQFAGQIVFPNGNPFPGGQLPSLRIRCRDQQADRVERALSPGKDGRFYTVFKRGQTYDLYWFYFMGGREKFFSVRILTNGPAIRRLTIPYRVKSNAKNSRTPPNAANGTNSAPVSSGNYQPPTTGPAYRPPVAGPAFKPPATGPAFVPPQTGKK